MRIFERTILSSDIETGEKSRAGEAGSRYLTNGYKDGKSIKNQYERATETQCSLWNLHVSCSQTQIESLANGTARVRNMVVIDSLA